MTATIIPLIDGALYSDPRVRRERMVEAMAAHLVLADVFRNADDSFRVLMWTGEFSCFDVMRCLDDARQVAEQKVVAKEMGAS